MHAEMPPELRQYLGSESAEVAVKAERKYNKVGAIFILLFGVGWLLFSAGFMLVMVLSLLSGSENMTVNGEPVEAGTIPIFPMVFIGVFVLIGLVISYFGVRMFIAKGDWFVGTRDRFIQWNPKSVRSYDWEQFTGDVHTTGNQQKGNLIFTLRQGQMVSQKNGPSRYVPIKIYMGGIENPYEVERTFRKRIKANDPTPAVA